MSRIIGAFIKLFVLIKVITLLMSLSQLSYALIPSKSTGVTSFYPTQRANRIDISCIPRLNHHYYLLKHLSAKSDDNSDANRWKGDAPKLDINENYYDIIEADYRATAEELKKAFYKVVFKYHPDRKVSKVDKDLCNRQMMVINFAFKVLKDPVTRAQYDDTIRIVIKKSHHTAHNSAASKTSSTRTSSSSSSSYDASYIKREMEKKVNEVRAAREIQAARQQQDEQRRDQQQASSHADDISALLRSVSDGTLESLRWLADKLRLKRDEVNQALTSDTRDWGEVFDTVTSVTLIEQRLKLLENFKLLRKRVAEVEALIQDRMRRKDFSSARSESKDYSDHHHDPWPRPRSYSRQPDETMPQRERSPPPPAPPRVRTIDESTWQGRQSIRRKGGI